MILPQVDVSFHGPLYEVVFLHDVVRTVTGEEIALYEGLALELVELDLDDDGQRDDLFARGTVELNRTGRRPTWKWCCRIDQDGVRHRSDIT